MSSITKPNTFTAGNKIIAAEHNSNFDTIYNDYNGSIDNSNISASAAIAASKLNLTSVTQTMTFNNNGNAIPLTIANAGTEVSEYINVTANGQGISILNAGNNNCITILHKTTKQASTGHALSVQSTAANTDGDSSLALLQQSNASTTAHVLELRNSGTGYSLYIKHDAAVGDTATALRLDGCNVANGTATISLSNLGPDWITTSTVASWLAINISGTAYYIPMWT
jgi:hypothetical protein